jgi:hypothetical protein
MVSDGLFQEVSPWPAGAPADDASACPKKHVPIASAATAQAILML